MNFNYLRTVHNCESGQFIEEVFIQIQFGFFFLAGKRNLDFFSRTQSGKRVGKSNLLFLALVNI